MGEFGLASWVCRVMTTSTKIMVAATWQCWRIRASITPIGVTFGLDLPDAAALGENFTAAGLIEDEVHLGDVFEVGTAVVQVCQPRTPCYKLAARFGRKDMSVLV